MIRTRITPKNTDLHLSIPEMYVGKNIEVLLYAVDEIKEEPKSPVTMKDFRGTLSKESAAKLQEKIQKEREEWN
ncbi:hypothetical protein [Leptospira mayottensis]|uniref:Uncharacterized protein n=2 Tax=Leptospira mayottensis TaxID=1137606 RepID=A0AA87MNG2_9LEPT|nr:hypothetical protein [Leptospira mayottensis]AXR60308.1 hypothetical protein DQM68_05970 [Leptospira mayottensis]AXR64112.1 hypothetical protein DQM28_07630 [Leptospira mayottensis]AXR64125.1 hypothetical protein DQM28_07705 [Leptospira mayottensis]AZQ03262.1 hypothetical protein LEP1GSC190_15720 [Leptospira mayottensis 200901116]EKR99382.1 hypothetical protein LEP1GSC125_4130 [Leptospira mayottensis 200901122]